MKSTNRKRVLLVSGSIILLCMTIIIGMSFALFTDTDRVSNHLKAGKLNITLTRTSLVKTSLDANGYLDTSDPDTTVVNFSDSSSNTENVFNIDEEKEKIVPGCKYVAEMQIENKSDVAFGYWIEIECKDKTAGENLAKQLKITVNTGTDKSDFIGEGLVVKGENDGYIGALAIGATGTFTVTLEFLDSVVADNNIEDNDKAQGETLDFDLVVYAVQLTEAPTNTP